MNSVKAMMKDREEEINSYLALLIFIQQSSGSGLPVLHNKGNGQFALENTHFHILAANTYLLLYNYIEAVITQSLDTLDKYIKAEQKFITTFNQSIQKEWLSRELELGNAQTTIETRLTKGLKMLQHFNGIQLDIKISKGGGGNFNDEEIIKLAKKLNMAMTVDRDTNKNLRKTTNKVYRTSKKFSDTCMKEITRERNKLAHGEITFQECGKHCNITDLEDIKNTTFQFVHIFTQTLEDYIDQKKYLI